MELIIIVAVVIVVLGYFIIRDRKYEQEGNHPLEGATKAAEVPYKVEPPVLTTKVDGIGHESVTVKETVKKDKKAAPKKTSNTAKPKVAKTKTVKTTKPAKATSKPKKTTKK
jgi:hypothetical protein